MAIERSTSWHHGPVHLSLERGIYMVTGGTFRKQKFFLGEANLDLLQETFFNVTDEFGWLLRAWALFPNHYHFLAESPENAETLSRMVSKLHGVSARSLNTKEGVSGRKVWHQFWDTRISFERSYLARLRYVNENPVRHGLVSVAEQYPWCSAAWFARTAPSSFREAVNGFKIDKVNVYDDF